MEDEAEGNDDEKRSYGAEAGREEHAGATRTDGDDDEDDLGAFEHGDVEGGGEGDLVPWGGAVGELTHGFGVLCEGGLFVVKRDKACRSEDGFAQPTQAEQQKKGADGELEDGAAECE